MKGDRYPAINGETSVAMTAIQKVLSDALNRPRHRPRQLKNRCRILARMFKMSRALPMMTPKKLRVIEGGRSERLLQSLLREPEAFDEDTFDELLERFRAEISPAAAYDLIVERLRRLPARSELEKQAVIAVATGDTATAARLRETIVRRNALGLRLVSSGACD